MILAQANIYKTMFGVDGKTRHDVASD